jgi:hypothetical protein
MRNRDRERRKVRTEQQKRGWTGCLGKICGGKANGRRGGQWMGREKRKGWKGGEVKGMEKERGGLKGSVRRRREEGKRGRNLGDG